MIFETSRLRVRLYETTDLDVFFSLNGSPAVMRYIRDPYFSREEAKKGLEDILNNYALQPGLGKWAVVDREDPAVFMGTFAIFPIQDDVRIQLGYSLLNEYWGHGYATELVMEGLLYARDILNLQTIYAIIDPENHASRHVLEKAGFHTSGTVIRSGMTDGLLFEHPL